jgi:hypothetical protein
MDAPSATKIVILLFSAIAAFLLSAYLIMYTYNKSVVKMNPQWQSINYETALMFTLFTMLVFRSGYARSL